MHVRVTLGVWVVSKKRVSAFKDGARGSSGQTCLSESALVLSLEVHPPDVLKPPKLKRNPKTRNAFHIPPPNEFLQNAIKQTFVLVKEKNLASTREKRLSRKKKDKKENPAGCDFTTSAGLILQFNVCKKGCPGIGSGLIFEYVILRSNFFYFLGNFCVFFYGLHGKAYLAVLDINDFNGYFIADFNNFGWCL